MKQTGYFVYILYCMFGLFFNQLRWWQAMSLIVCGVNHKTAPLPLREQLAITQERQADAVQQAINTSSLVEAVILSTCNRSEIYAIADHEDAVVDWLCDFHELALDRWQDHAYIYKDEQAVNHLLSVCCGLDSMVLGEPQIFGQVKDAFHIATESGSVGPYINLLFHHVFSVTKRIRTETSIGKSPVSVASAAINLAKCIFTDFKQLNVLLIGIGEMTESAQRYFSDHKVQKMFIANRTLAKAEHFAKKNNAHPISLADINEILPQVDIILSATASAEPLLTYQMMEQAVNTVRKRPFLLLDLAVPRDIEASVAELEGAYLYNIDDLLQITQAGLAQREEAALAAQKIIEHEVIHFTKHLQEKQFSATIRAYRQQAEALRQQEVANALRMLAKGQEPEKVLTSMARSLTNKLMHQPSVQLRQASYSGHWEILAAAKRLFGLAEGDCPVQQLSLSEEASE